MPKKATKNIFKVTVYFPESLYRIVAKAADKADRSLSKFIVVHLKKHFQKETKEITASTNWLQSIPSGGLNETSDGWKLKTSDSTENERNEIDES